MLQINGLQIYAKKFKFMHVAFLREHFTASMFDRKQNKVTAVICIEGGVRKRHFSRRNVTYINLNSLPLFCKP